MNLCIKKDKINVFVELISILIVSILIFKIMSGFGTNIFLFDDNKSQWLPIIDSAFETFFEEGYLPFIDFYQMKGMNILEPGFYSLINPFMWIAFLIGKTILKSQEWNTITIYIYIMFILGNVFVYYSCKNSKLRVLDCFVITLCYATVTPYVFLGYWYYVFNTYMIMPLLLYIIIKYNNRKHIYYLIGIVLALSIYMGNLQYTLYQYIVIGIIFSILSLSNDIKYLKILFYNILISILLGFPQLILAVRASKKASYFSQNVNPEFFVYPLNPIKVFLGGMIPPNLLEKLPKLNSFVQNLKPIENEFWGPIGFYFIGGLFFCFLISIVVIILTFKNRKINRKDKDTFDFDFTLAVIIACVFFLFFMFGKKFILAIVMSKMPIIKNFRLLHKLILMLPPLFVISAIFLFNYKFKYCYKQILRVICICLSMFGLMSFNISTQDPMRYDETKIALHNSGIKTEDYRLLTFIEFNDDEFVKEVHSDMEKKLIRNMSTVVKVFTAGGYNISYDKASFDQTNEFLKDEWAFPGFSYSNAVRAKDFFEALNNNNNGLKERIYNQIDKNSIKYFLFRHDSAYEEKFINLINESEKFNVKRVIKFMNDYDIVELNNVTSLCSDNNGEKINIKSSMSKLKFRIKDNTQNIYLQFTYDKKYKAKFTPADGGKIIYLDINKTDDGYMQIKSENLKAGKVQIYYSDFISNLAVVFSIITTLISIVVFFFKDKIIFCGITSSLKII